MSEIEVVTTQKLSPPDRRMLAHAWKIAAGVHGGQTDLQGQPYMFHVARVAMALESPVEQVCGLLHDVLEDCGDADDHYFRTVIERDFPAIVIVTCEVLARNSKQDYMQYIERVAMDPMARKVKIADLMDNLQPKRLATLPVKDRLRLWNKYYPALFYLAQHGD